MSTPKEKGICMSTYSLDRTTITVRQIINAIYMANPGTGVHKYEGPQDLEEWRVALKGFI